MDLADRVWPHARPRRDACLLQGLGFRVQGLLFIPIPMVFGRTEGPDAMLACFIVYCLPSSVYCSGLIRVYCLLFIVNCLLLSLFFIVQG